MSGDITPFPGHDPVRRTRRATGGRPTSGRSPDEPVLRLRDVSKTHGDVTALRGVSLDVGPGELVAVVGPSGSGKSTMLNVMGTLDRPSAGTVSIAGTDVDGMSDDSLSALRSERVGFVFQHFHLQTGASTVENVADGLLYAGVGRRERLRRAAETLELVGLGHRGGHRPHQLSGGERQRVAIARAVVGRPSILLADEPTGALDSASGTAVLGLLRALHDAGTTVLVITHDLELAAALPRRIRMRDGSIEHDSGGAGEPGSAADLALAIGGAR